jgi:dihydroorotase
MLEMAAQGIFTIEKVVEKMCHAPAELYHIDRRGFLRPGYYADLVLVSPDAHNLVTDAQVVSRCGWTPFAGITFSHRVAATYVNGALAYDHGTFSDNLHGEKLRFNLS